MTTGSVQYQSVKSLASCWDDYQTDSPVLFFLSSLQLQQFDPELSPQDFLDSLLRSRGYSTERYQTRQTSCHNTPTLLQQASYDVFLIGLVRRNDAAALDAVLSSGISPNPSNRFGESLVHNICRRGNHALLDILLRNGCCLHVCDDYGRTPLHDACWAPEPAFETVHRILKNDTRLLHMLDARGDVPLKYVQKEHWGEWVDFLDAIKDIYWSPRSSSEPEQGPPQHALEGPNTRPIPDPKNALTLDLARLVASGRMRPEEAKLLTMEATLEMTELGDDSSEDDSTDCSDESSFSDDSSIDEEEMSVLLADLRCVKTTAQAVRV
jgi:hypothetical protein